MRNELFEGARFYASRKGREVFFERKPKGPYCDVSFHPERCDCGMFGHTTKRKKSLIQRVVMSTGLP